MNIRQGSDHCPHICVWYTTFVAMNCVHPIVQLAGSQVYKLVSVIKTIHRGPLLTPTIVVPLKVKLAPRVPKSTGMVKPPEPEDGIVVPGVQMASGAQGSLPSYAVVTVVGPLKGISTMVVTLPDVTVQGGPCLCIKVEADTTPATTIRVITLSSSNASMGAVIISKYTA